MNKFLQIYNTLYKEFGPQGWWPVKSKYNKENYFIPRDETEVFEIIIGTILTQNTAWKNVELALNNLRNNNLINIKKIKNYKQEKLGELIRPSGYFNQKAERLKLMAEFLDKNKIKNLEKLETTKLRNMLLELKGVGPETADSILLYAFKKPIFVIDTYTKRIFSRIGLIKEGTYEYFQEAFHKNLKQNFIVFNEYHALIIELAKNNCKVKPFCEDCILRKECKNKIKNN